MGVDLDSRGSLERLRAHLSPPDAAQARWSRSVADEPGGPGVDEAVSGIGDVVWREPGAWRAALVAAARRPELATLLLVAAPAALVLALASAWYLLRTFGGAAVSVAVAVPLFAAASGYCVWTALRIVTAPEAARDWSTRALALLGGCGAIYFVAAKALAQVGDLRLERPERFWPLAAYLLASAPAIAFVTADLVRSGARLLVCEAALLWGALGLSYAYAATVVFATLVDQGARMPLALDGRNGLDLFVLASLGLVLGAVALRGRWRLPDPDGPPPGAAGLLARAVSGALVAAVVVGAGLTLAR